jgi:multidrug resistance efflux pump
MSLTSDLKTHYEAVLEHLEAERQQAQQQMAALQTRLKELHNSISTLARTLNPDAPPTSRSSASLRPAHLKYANISVRWAILDLLHDSNAMTTSEIAEALKAAGVQTRATNFANNVSAVLSTTMREKHSEVQQLPDGQWELTESGVRAIEHIRNTPKFRRGCGWF